MSLDSLKETGIDPTYSKAFRDAYNAFPHTFVTALLSTMLSIQLVGLGVMALQNKRYFEDLFHLSSTAMRKLKQPVD